MGTRSRASLVPRPEVIAFDVMETMFSLASLEPLLAAAGGDHATLRLWFSRLLADGFALAAAGDYKPFSEVAKASLRTVLPKAKAAARDSVLAGLSELDVLPDSGPAMGRAILDLRVVVLTNTSQEVTAKLLAKGALDAFVETVISADDMKAWKPRSNPYMWAASTAGVEPERLAVVTVHPWDVLGARRAGVTTGWCNRGGPAFPTAFGRPHVTGANLLEVVEKLLALETFGDA